MESSGAGEPAAGRSTLHGAADAGRAPRGVADVPALPDGGGRPVVGQPDDGQQFGRLPGAVALPPAGHGGALGRRRLGGVAAPPQNGRRARPARAQREQGCSRLPPSDDPGLPQTL